MAASGEQSYGRTRVAAAQAARQTLGSALLGRSGNCPAQLAGDKPLLLRQSWNAL